MYSFTIHNIDHIGNDTSLTDWETPKTVWDKIRCAYKDNERGYYIRDTVVYPAAHDIVKPLQEGAGHVIEWWVDPNVKVEEEIELGKSDSEDSEASSSSVFETDKKSQ